MSEILDYEYDSVIPIPRKYDPPIQVEKIPKDATPTELRDLIRTEIKRLGLKIAT